MYFLLDRLSRICCYSKLGLVISVWHVGLRFPLGLQFGSMNSLPEWCELWQLTQIWIWEGMLLVCKYLKLHNYISIDLGNEGPVLEWLCVLSRLDEHPEDSMKDFKLIFLIKVF